MDKKKIRKVLIFMPFIGIGGVEKNLFIISNFLSKKVDLDANLLKSISFEIGQDYDNLVLVLSVSWPIEITPDPLEYIV